MLERKTSIAAISASNCLGMLSFVSLPLWLGALIGDLGISEGLAGKIASAQLGGMAMMALSLSRKADLLPWRTLGIVAVCLAIAGNLFSMFLENIWFLVGARILAGMGEGKLLAIGNSAAAGCKEPQKMYSLMTICLSTMFLGVALIAPSLIESFGRQGIFVLMLGLNLLGLPVLLWFPKSRAASGQEPIEAGGMGKGALLVLSGLGFCQMAQALLWAYNGQIGLGTGLSLAGVGRVLALVALISITGPLLAKKLGMRLGPMIPIYLALGLMILAALMLGYAGSPWMYVGGSIILPTLGLFANPYAMALLASLDPRGRAAAAAPAFIGAGDTFGPLAGSFLTNAQGYIGLGWCAAIMLILSAVFFYPYESKKIHEGKAGYQ